MVNCKKILFQHALGPSKLVTSLNLMAKMLAGYQVEAAPGGFESLKRLDAA